MGLRKDIKELKKQMDDLTQNLDSKVIYKAQKYDELMNDLRPIKFDDLNIKSFYDEFGNKRYVMHYSLQTELFFEDGDVVNNPLFISINKLDMLSEKDTKKIINLLKNEKKQK